MASEMVMAIGDSGQPELTPADEVVSIGVYPAGPLNAVTPRTVAFNVKRTGGGRPLKLISVRRPQQGDQLPFVKVRFETTPFVRYTTDDGAVMGNVSGCCLTCLSDAEHPVFDGLSNGERARIRRVTARWDAQRA